MFEDFIVFFRHSHCFRYILNNHFVRYQTETKEKSHFTEKKQYPFICKALMKEQLSKWHPI